MSEAAVEAFFGLAERPFSLTVDPRYFFRSHSHGRALDLLTLGLRRRDPFLLVAGDLGAGKSTVCRVLMEQARRFAPAAYLSSPLLSGPGFERVLLAGLGVPAIDVVDDTAVVVIDEAHSTPRGVVDVLHRLSADASRSGKLLQVVFAVTPSEGRVNTSVLPAFEGQITTRARLLPLGRDDCHNYVKHRLATAGAPDVALAPRAIDALFSLSGGIPRLINLLCERALREAAAAHSRRIDASLIEGAASALQLLRARPRRFRWFHRHVS